MKRLLICISTLVFFVLSTSSFAGNSLVSLGGSIYNDKNLSINENQACMTCHHPSAGFADPENRVSPVAFPVSKGSDPTLFGGRNAPTAAYAGFSPVFHFDGENFVGGLFWDGRATGRMDVTATGGLGSGPTGDPLADQAKGPFGNPVEMGLTLENTGMTTEEAVISIIQNSDYWIKFEYEFGPDAFADIPMAYNNASLAIAAFERSKKLIMFNSKFDKFLKEQGGDVSDFGVVVGPDGFRRYVGPPMGFYSKYFSYDEAVGLAIFNSDSYMQIYGMDDSINPNGGMCYTCHLTANHEVTIENLPVNGPNPGIYPPMLTDFTYENMGIPVNPRIAELAGVQPTDFGLGVQTDQLDAAYGEYTGNQEPYPYTADELGKFKVSTLRNISRTAPYGHNGFFATLDRIVHFYNTRDNGTWPVAEVPETVNTTKMGNLGLTLNQEQKLVSFLKTLND